MTKRVYLSPPDLGGDEKKHLLDTLASNWIAPVGPNIEAFEKAICRHSGTAGCSALSSGTAAIHLALHVLGISEGDIVYTSTHTHIGSVNPIIQRGAIPVFIDVESDSWNMDPNVLEDAIRQIDDQKIKLPSKSGSNRREMIMPVHIYGMPSAMESISEIAKRRNAFLVEDAAEALGSMLNGKSLGAFGDLGVFSFNGNKIVTTGGGGALVSNDEALTARATFLATQAREELPYYEHLENGYNYRLSNVLAAIGIGQIANLEDRVSKRRANFARYKAYFESWNDRGFNIEFQEESEDALSNRWLTAILVRPEKNHGLTTEKIRAALDKDNIESRYLWKPMHLQPVLKGYPYFGGTTAQELFENGLCLPSGTDLTDADFERIFGVMDQSFKGHLRAGD